MSTSTPQLSSPPKVIAGVALALALTTYGIAAKHRTAVAAPVRTGSSVLPKREWRPILTDIARDIAEKHFGFVAAAVAFNAFLSIPATFAVLVSLGLLLFDPGALQRALQPVEHLIPSYVMRLLAAPHSRETLGIGLLVSLGIDLWTALSGSSGMLTALSLLSGSKTKPSFIHRQLAVLVLAAITVPFVLLALLLVVVLPVVIDLLPLSPLAKTSLWIARWPILAVLFMAMLAAVYRYAPHRAERPWRWTSWGAVAATALWLVGSGVFSLYLSEFIPYDRTYGALGSIMGLLAWLNLLALAVLLGAQIDAEIERERQTR